MLKKLIFILSATLLVSELESEITDIPTYFVSDQNRLHIDDELDIQEDNVDKSIKRHLLPEDHVIKETLDRIFSSSPVLASLENMRAAGFIKPEIRKKQMIIGRHPDIKGFLLKVYLDTSDIDVMVNYTNRINGAESIRKLIDELGYQDVCIVPKKWLYKIPSLKDAKEDKTNNRQKYILVVEQINIKKVGVNCIFYKSDSITTRHLDALFDIVTTLGLFDSLRIGNAPYTDDGYLAFIDTEFHGNPRRVWKLIHSLTPLLSPENGVYWEHLCNTNAPN